MTNQYRYDVFLSHNSADKNIVRLVATRLHDAGLNVWFDEWIIEVGDDIYLSIESGLEQSRALVLFISSNALKSNWVDLERSTALFRDPTNKTRRFIPIVIDECDIPDTLRRYRYLDFRHDKEKGIVELIEIYRRSTGQRLQRQNADFLDEYRRAHISRYEALIDGRNLIKVTAIGRSGSLIEAGLEVESWVESSSSFRLAVLGDPGSGKTYLLRQLCSRLAGRPKFTPIFINAGQLRNLKPAYRDDLLAFADPPVPDTSILDVKNVIIIIDGLDELIGPTSCEQTEYSETLDAIGKLIPARTRLIFSCRSTSFEATSSVVNEALGTKVQKRQLTDTTDEAILTVLDSKRTSKLERIQLTELTKDQARSYLSKMVAPDVIDNQAAAYVLEHLPRVPMILRFLQLALPEIRCSTGAIDLDELYSVALRAWILRDSAFADQDINVVWDEIRNIHAFGSVRFSDATYIEQLIHSGLVIKTPTGMHAWSHFSIDEFFLAISLFEEIKQFNAKTLAKLNLIGSYNVNRFLLPMCRRKLTTSNQAQIVNPIISSQYSAFLKASGWRQTSGYGIHPSYNAQDGTGFISGINDLEPEQQARPDMDSMEAQVCGISWYDAFAYCLWCGESLPHSEQLDNDSSLLHGLWYWCSNWRDERKAHVAVVARGIEGVALRRGGVNPDFRHRHIGMVTVRDSRKGALSNRI